MALFGQYALQKAVYDVLTADSGLMATITGVYDHVPPGTAYPYVTIGDSQAEDYSTMTSTAYRHRITLHVYSRSRGRKEALDILAKIHALLHNTSPSATDHVVVDLRYMNSEVRLDADGLTVHGTMVLRALAEVEV